VIEFRSTSAEVIRLNLILVRWTIKDTNEDIGNFRFTVRKSYSPGGPFEAITGPLVNTFQFFDQALQMKSNWRKMYYRILAQDVVKGETIESPVAGIESDPDLFLLELRRRHDLYLKRFVGIPASVLVAKTFGQRCVTCHDQIKQRVRSSACLQCFGMGFHGGYFNQVDTFINFSPSPELVALLEIGERQPNQTNLWTINFPELSPRDMIVEFPPSAEQRRWRVVTVGRTERLRATSRQIAQVTEINRNDVEYQVPVDKFLPPRDTFLGFRPPNGSALL